MFSHLLASTTENKAINLIQEVYHPPPPPPSVSHLSFRLLVTERSFSLPLPPPPKSPSPTTQSITTHIKRNTMKLKQGKPPEPNSSKQNHTKPNHSNYLARLLLEKRTKYVSRALYFRSMFSVVTKTRTKTKKHKSKQNHLVVTQ